MHRKIIQTRSPKGTIQILCNEDFFLRILLYSIMKYGSTQFITFYVIFSLEIRLIFSIFMSVLTFLYIEVH